MPAPGLQDRAHDLLGGLPRRAPWPARALLQAGRPLAQIAVDPLVARLAGDAVECAQFAGPWVMSRSTASAPHWCLASVSGVTHVSRLKRYVCLRTVPIASLTRDTSSSSTILRTVKSD